MSITIDISDEKLCEAKAAMNIQDPTQLFLTLLDEKLAQSAAQRHLATFGGSMPGMEMPLRDRSQRALRPFDFERTLAAAEALGDLSEEEFDAFEREINRPLPPAWTECE